MPVQLTIRVRDKAIKTVNGKFALLLPRIPALIVRPEIEQARDELRTYPEKLPNQQYVRTYNRYRRTRVEHLSGQSYRLISDPTYKGHSADPYVLGDAEGHGQASIHWGRWTLLRVAVDGSVFHILEKVRDAFNKIISEGSAPGL